MENSNSTAVGVSAGAWWLRMSSARRSSPLVTPKRANVMASRMVVLPAPVGPWMRKNERPASSEKSTTWRCAYGPKACMTTRWGLMAPSGGVGG